PGAGVAVPGAGATVPGAGAAVPVPGAGTAQSLELFSSGVAIAVESATAERMRGSRMVLASNGEGTKMSFLLWFAKPIIKTPLQTVKNGTRTAQASTIASITVSASLAPLLPPYYTAWLK